MPGLAVRVAFVVARIERLQRMADAPGPLGLVVAGDGVLFVEELQQLGQRRGGIARLAVAHAFADEADVQRVARRHQRFEEQVAILAARVAVAAARLAEDLVEAGVVAGARELALVHAEQADHTERDRALRHQPAEGHPAEQEGLALRHRVERTAQRLAHHAPRQRRVGVGLRGLAGEAGGEPAQGVERVLLGVVARVGQEQRVDPFQQPLAPCGQRARAGEGVARLAQFAEQAVELAQRLHRAAGDALQRQDAVEQFALRILARDQPGVHAVEAELPRIRVDRRRAGLGLHRGIQAPRHASTAQPALQRVAAAGVDREAPRHCRHVEEIQHLADREAALGQVQHLRERVHQRVRPRQPHIGQVPGNVQRIAAVLRRLAEYRRQIGRVRADIRRHHHDVAMLQRGIVGQAAQQGVLQHFQFAQAGVAGVHAQAGVVAQRGQDVAQAGTAGLLFADRRADQFRLQTADAGLQPGEQRGGFVERLGLVERVALVDRVALVQGEAEILRDAAERHQQRMADLVIQRFGIVRMGEQEALLAQIDPMFAARVGEIQMHRRVQRGRLQRRQHVGRQMADAEYVQRRIVGQAVAGTQRVEQGGAALRAVRALDGGSQPMPQRCLPVVAVAARMLFPVEDPVRPVDQVLGVQAGEVLGELEAAPRGIVAGQIGADLRRVRRGQHLQQAPAQHFVPIRTADQCLVAQHALRAALEPLPRQDHLVVGGDAVTAVRTAALRQAAEQPALQPRVRHHHGLRGQRIGRPLRFQLQRQRIGQPLGAAAAMDDQPAWVFLHPFLPR